MPYGTKSIHSTHAASDEAVRIFKEFKKDVEMSRDELACLFGVTRETIQGWANDPGRQPPKSTMMLIKILSGEITADDMIAKARKDAVTYTKGRRRK